MSKHVHCNVATPFDTSILLMQNRPSDTLWLEFGAWIKEHREKHHLSQAGAAQRAAIDRQQWYRIESGKSGTKRDTVIAIANAVSADVGEALRRAGFSNEKNGSLDIQIADDIRVSLLNGKDYTDEDRAEFEIGLGAAYEALKARIEERKRRNE